MFRLASCVVFLLFVAFGTGHEVADAPRSEMTYQVKTTWDDRPIDHDPVTVTFIGRGSEGVEMKVDAPFFGLPGNPGGEPGKPFDKLWEYEVVEAFFADGDAEKPKYLEVELCPWGQHIVLLLDGVHNAVAKLLPLQFTASKNSTRWTGSAIIPPTYFPPRVTRFNVYAIHDVEGVEGDPRRYESLFPVPKGKYENADFHRLEYFRPLDFESLQPGNSDAEPSCPWPKTQSNIEEDDDAEEIEAELISIEGQTSDARALPKTIEIKKALSGGDKMSKVTLKMEPMLNSSNGQEDQLIIKLSAQIPDNGSKILSTSEPLPVEDLDSYETNRFITNPFHFGVNDNGINDVWTLPLSLRVYFSNEDRKVLQLIFNPSGQYDVRICSAPYNIISRGHRILVISHYIDEVWNVEARLPLPYLPANTSKVLLGAVFTNNGVIQYEATYSITNAGLSLPDLMVLNKYEKLKDLFPEGVNEDYSHFWDTGK